MPVRILVVDDFKPWRVAAGSILETTPGLQIIGEAEDGLQAIEKAAKLMPDVVLLDMEMPRLNGLGAATKIRQLCPESKIIFVTQQNDEDLRSAAFAAGAVGYVLKSRAACDLGPTIEAALFRPQPLASAGSQPELAF